MNYQVAIRHLFIILIKKWKNLNIFLIDKAILESVILKRHHQCPIFSSILVFVLLFITVLKQVISLYYNCCVPGFKASVVVCFRTPLYCVSLACPSLSIRKYGPIVAIQKTWI